MEDLPSHISFDVRQPFGKRHLQPQDELANGNMEPKKSNQQEHPARPAKQDSLFEREVAEMFTKKFKYQRASGTQWQLPPVKELFAEYYQLENLQQLRERLNSVKSKLNEYVLEDWSVHTHRNDPAGQVQWLIKNETRAEFATVAWCKFYECLKQYPLVKGPKLNTLHLCEAPGAFIAALNHYLYSTYARDEVQWNWLSTTLNPYYEGNALGKMIIDDRFIFYTLERWLFHANFTGNIIDRANIDSMQRQCAQRLDNEVHLITADGSIDCVETPDCQEEFVSLLHSAEICAALSILAEGGCFVLKLFTLFEATTVSKMYLLNCVFEEVHVFKPATSKRGNSENYIICLGFKKQQLPNFQATLELMKLKLSEEEHVLPIFRKSHIPNDFMLQHEICARRFMNLQINAIEANIVSFELKLRAHAKRTRSLRSLVANEYYKRYNIQPLPEELTILYKRKGSIHKGITTNMYKGSYAERKCLKDTSAATQIFMLRGALNDLEKSLSGRYDTLLQESHKNGQRQQKLELHLYRGAAYETLRSSLFAAVHVLLMRQQLQEMLHYDPLWQGEPKCMLFKDNALETSETVALEIAEFNFSSIQQNFMLKVLSALLKCKPQKLIFSNFAFLTHFSVSILRLLALNFFEQFSVATEPRFEITLQQCEYQEDNVKLLESLINLLQQHNNVLCVIDIKLLHRNEFSCALTEFNNLLLLSKFKLMLNN